MAFFKNVVSEGVTYILLQLHNKHFTNQASLPALIVSVHSVGKSHRSGSKLWFLSEAPGTIAGKRLPGEDDTRSSVEWAARDISAVLSFLLKA